MIVGDAEKRIEPTRCDDGKDPCGSHACTDPSCCFRFLPTHAFACAHLTPQPDTMVRNQINTLSHHSVHQSTSRHAIGSIVLAAINSPHLAPRLLVCYDMHVPVPGGKKYSPTFANPRTDFFARCWSRFFVGRLRWFGCHHRNNDVFRRNFDKW